LHTANDGCAAAAAALLKVAVDIATSKLTLAAATAAEFADSKSCRLSFYCFG